MVPAHETDGYKRYVRFLPLKRLMDCIGALVGLVLLMPLLLVIALLVRWRCGQVIFVQGRVGSDGRIFRFYKFCTMRAGSDSVLQNYLAANSAAAEEWDFSHKLRHDPRLTPMTSTLRRWSIDELPQLFNVLKGEMSLIGPRPITPNEVERYGNYFADYKACLPGLTGLWQIRGRSEVSFERQARLNSIYIRRWKPALDAHIFLRTLLVLLSRRGAY